MAEVKLVGVTKAYPNGFVALHNIDLKIADRDFLVVVGPSGCGKSTLLRLIAGLETLTEGRVLIGDRDVSRLEPAQRDIAMVFQNYALYPHMNVYDNMAYGLRNRKVPKAEIDKRVRETARHARPRYHARTPAAPAFRRPAPARRHGPCHRTITRPRSCSMNRCPILTPSCGCRCAARSNACSASSAPPAST